MNSKADGEYASEAALGQGALGADDMRNVVATAKSAIPVIKLGLSSEIDKLARGTRGAVIFQLKSGTRKWFCDGKLHREDGPAIEGANGYKAWYRDGKLHRADGPAEERADGYKAWYRDDQLHRDDGPAVEEKDGRREWYRNGKLHRDDGPAVVDKDGYKAWYRDDEPHRDDGPAVEEKDGRREWFRDGKRHRDDGPAVESANGYRAWYRDGKRHRNDGPAVEYTDGYREWYRDGILIKRKYSIGGKLQYVWNKRVVAPLKGYLSGFFNHTTNDGNIEQKAAAGSIPAQSKPEVGHDELAP